MRRSAAPSRSGMSHTEKRQKITTMETDLRPLSEAKLPSTVIPELPLENTELNSQETKYFEAVYAKMSNKKHKKWEGDGFIIINGRYVKLVSETGKSLASGSGNKLSFLTTLEEGSIIKVGGLEAQLINSVSLDVFRAKVACTPSSFNATEALKRTKITTESSTSDPIFTSLADENISEKTVNLTGTNVHSSFKAVMNTSSPSDRSSNGLMMPRPPSHCIWIQNPDGLPITDVVLESQLARRLRPHQKEGVRFLYECLMGFRYLGEHHCVEHNLSSIPSNEPIYGCILADEMGLGKTVQAIATLWMLLTQGPYGSRPVVQRCLIVTPSSLIQNWAKEISKWLGRERLPCYCVSQTSSIKAYLTQPGRVAPVIIMSYEMFLQRSSEVYDIPNLDMVICDEGHRLKNAGINTALALRNLPARRRLLLTGTPVQNQLEELWSLTEFCAPGRLAESQEAFRRDFVLRRSSSRSSTEFADNSSDTEDSESPENRLTRLLSTFLLRRTSEVIKPEMTKKSDFVVFCRASPLQRELETALRQWVQQTLDCTNRGFTPGPGIFLEDDDEENDSDEDDKINKDLENVDPCRRIDNDLQSDSSSSSILCTITAFRKMYNHPLLLHKFLQPTNASSRLHPKLSSRLLSILARTSIVPTTSLESYFNENPHLRNTIIRDSGKLTVLAHMLRQLFPVSCARTGQKSQAHKLVLVSNFTQTLDLLETLCRALTHETLIRLDGQTPNKRRMSMVQDFNDPSSSARILLLSSRAGGTGLNLIGADHLILFDMDWNPASDAQAMARIWRPGQSRPVRLYRLVTGGGLEERMFQRQAAKLAISHRTLDTQYDFPFGLDPNSTKHSGVLTREELRDLFQTPPPNCVSWTHELIECQCQVSNVTPSPSLSTTSGGTLINDDDSDEKSQNSFTGASDEDDESADRRICQLGPSLLRTNNFLSQKASQKKHSNSMSESLAFLMNWTHSLSYSTISELGDPLLCSSSEEISVDEVVSLPISAVFSQVTQHSETPTKAVHI